MELQTASVLVLIIVLGSMLALRGSEVLRGFARLLGGSVLGGAGGYIGFRLGDHFGGEWEIAYAVSLGLLCFLVGFLFGPKLLQVVLSVSIFVMGGVVGYVVAEYLGGTGAVPVLAGLVAGLGAAWIISSIARRLLLAATIAFGSAMVSAGLLILLIDDMPVEHAGILSFSAFVALAFVGFIVHRSELSGFDIRK